jgi:hypothetical protein
MALTSGSRGRLSLVSALRTKGVTNGVAGLVFGVCGTLLIAFPWLGPGYIFGADWPGPRRFDFPATLTSASPVQAALAGAGLLVSGATAGKLLILLSLCGAGTFAFLALPEAALAARTGAAAFYLLNPFVYDRLIYGQVYLLAAYALIPLGAYLTHRVLERQSIGLVVGLAACLTVISAFSIHVFLLGCLIALSLVIAHWVSMPNKKALLHQARYLGLGTVLVGLGTSYWTLPLVSGRGRLADVLASIGSADLTAFASVPDRQLGLVPNLLGLYGFWAEASGRFAVMKVYVPAWPLMLGLILCLVAIGLGAALRSDSSIRSWAIGLAASGLVALVVEVALSSAASRPTVQWLAAHFLVVRGMRDASKWSVPIAFAESQLFGLGVSAAAAYLVRRTRSGSLQDLVVPATVGLMLALPVYYGNGVLYGLHGTVALSQYPSGWYAADDQLRSDPHPEKMLFLPWHEYMRLSFVRNQDPIVAPAAPQFFSVAVVVSSDPEVPGVSAPTNADQTAVSELVRAGPAGDWAPVLAAHDIKYVLLAREANWDAFSYLTSQSGFVEVSDYGSVILLRDSLTA